jgi:hypothetical protein
MSARMIKWIFFTLSVTLFPVVLKYFVLRVLHQFTHLSQLLEHGEMFLISFVISVDAIGDALFSPKEERESIFLFLFAGMSVLIILMATGAYAFVGEVSYHGDIFGFLDKDFLVQSSLVILFFSVISATFVKILAKP